MDKKEFSMYNLTYVSKIVKTNHNVTKEQIFNSWKLINEFVDVIFKNLSDSDKLYIELIKRI